MQINRSVGTIWSNESALVPGWLGTVEVCNTILCLGWNRVDIRAERWSMAMVVGVGGGEFHFSLCSFCMLHRACIAHYRTHRIQNTATCK